MIIYLAKEHKLQWKRTRKDSILHFIDCIICIQDCIYGIGCYHTFCKGELDMGIRFLATTNLPSQAIINIYSTEQHKKLSHIVFGNWTSEIDLVLIQLADVNLEDYQKVLPKNDLDRGEIYSIPNYKKNKKGSFVSFSNVEIRHSFAQRQQFHGLIKIDKISDKGCSGKLVTTIDKSETIGMLIADNEYNSFVLPIQKICQSLSEFHFSGEGTF